MKRFLAFFLSLIILFTMLPAQAFALEETPTEQSAAEKETAPVLAERPETIPEEGVEAESGKEGTLLERLFGAEQAEENCGHVFEDGVCAVCGVSEEEYANEIREKQNSCNHVFGQDGLCLICAISQENYLNQKQSACAHTFGEDGICVLCSMSEEELIQNQAACTHEFADGICTLCGLSEEEYSEKQEHCEHVFSEDGVCTICGESRDAYEKALREKQQSCRHEFDDEELCTLCGISREEAIRLAQENCAHTFGENGICTECGLTREEYEFDHRFLQEQVIDGVKITVEAPYGVFPEGAELSCSAIEDKTVSDAVDDALEPLREDDRKINSSFLFDIKVLYDGAEIEPDLSFGKVNVSFAVEQKVTDAAHVDVYHISGEAENNTLQAEKLDPEIETIPIEAEQMAENGFFAEGTEISVETDGFSYYVVEFTYNEKTYVMQGGAVAPLEEILNYLEIPGGEISNVSVSDETLIMAESLQDMVSGESRWMLISLQPFDTEEWLKVTVDGIEYEITVTDGSVDASHYTIDAGSTGGFVMGNASWAMTYTCMGNYTFSNTGAHNAGMSVAPGATVVLYIPTGYKLTAIGGAGKDTMAGGAGIEVPSNSTLYIVGGGTLEATGGAGGNGADGVSGHAPYVNVDNHGCDDSTGELAPGIGGDGGAGGGGGGSAIGTRGGDGGNGGAGGIKTTLNDKAPTGYKTIDGLSAPYWSIKSGWSFSGKTGKSGSRGELSPSSGKIYARNVTLILTGGAAGSNGKPGSGKGANKYDNGDTIKQFASGGGAGGGGWGGNAGAKVGDGGDGGGGGGGGGGGAAGNSWYNRDKGYPTAGDGESAGITVDRYGVTIYGKDGSTEKTATGGDGGMMGSRGKSYGTDLPSDYSGTPAAIARSFSLEGYTIASISDRIVSFSYNGDDYPALKSTQYPTDTGKGDQAFIGYYTTKDSADGICIYDANGKWTGNRLLPLADKEGTVTLYARFQKSVADILKADGTVVHYSELSNAVKEANNNETVRLRCDITLSDTLSIDKSLILDLNGFTLKNSSDSDGISVLISSAEGVPQIRNGTVSNTGRGTRTAVQAVLCAVRNADISAHSTDGTGIGVRGVGVCENSSISGFGQTLGIGMMLTKGNVSTLSAIGSGSINGSSYGTNFCAAIGLAGGTLTLDNKDISGLSLTAGNSQSKAGSLFYLESGTLKVTGGTWNGPVYGIVNNGGAVEVTGGTVTGGGESGAAAASGINNRSGSLKISGGVFKGNGQGSNGVFLDSGTTEWTITGGSFIGNSGISKSSKCSGANVTGGYFSNDLSNAEALVYDEAQNLCLPCAATADGCTYKLYSVLSGSVVKAANDVYDGDPKDGYTPTSDIVVNKAEYYSISAKGGREKLNSAPTEAGSYEVVLTGLTESAVTGIAQKVAFRETVKFEITPRPVYITVGNVSVPYKTSVNEIASKIDAATSIQDYSETDRSGVIGGSPYSVTVGFGTPGEAQPVDAGNYKYYISDFKVDGKINDNYQAVLTAGTGSFTFEKIPLSFTSKPVLKQKLEYNQTEQSLINDKGSAQHGEIRFAISTDGTVPKAEDYTETEPKRMERGTYKVYAGVFPERNDNPNNYIAYTEYIGEMTIVKGVADFWVEAKSSAAIRLGDGTPRTAVTQPLYKGQIYFNGVSVSGKITYKPPTGDPEINEFSSITDAADLTRLMKGRYAGKYTFELWASPTEDYEFPEGTELDEQGRAAFTGTFTIKGASVTVIDDFTGLTCENVTYGDVLSDETSPLRFENGPAGTLSWLDGQTALEGGAYNIKFVPAAGEISGDRTFAETNHLTINLDSDGGLVIHPKEVGIDWVEEDDYIYGYDAQAHTLNAVFTNLVGDDICTPVIEIFNSNGQKVTSAVNVGKYTAKITGVSDPKHYKLPDDEKSLSRQFEIVDINPNDVYGEECYGTVWGGTIDYGIWMYYKEPENTEFPENLTFSFRYSTDGGKTWSEPQADNPRFAEVGDYLVEYTVSIGTLSSTKISAVHLFKEDVYWLIETEPAFAGRTYDSGREINFLTREPVVSTGTVVYAVNRTGNFENSDFCLETPTAVNAGVYYISYRVRNDEGRFMNPPSEPMRVEIYKAKITSYTLPRLSNSRYDLESGADPVPLMTGGSIEGGWIEYAYTYTLHYNTGTDVTMPYSKEMPMASERGYYSPKIRFVPDENHTIDKNGYEYGWVEIYYVAVPDIPRAKTGLVYRPGVEQELITTDPEQTEGCTMQYRLDETAEWSTEIPTATEPGTYTVYYQIVPDKYNHYSYPGEQTGTVEVTIAPQKVNIDTITLDSRVYDGTCIAEATVECEDNDHNKFTVNIFGATDSPDVTEGGKPAVVRKVGDTPQYTDTPLYIIVSEGDAARYDLTIDRIEIEITPKEAELSWNDTELDYNGTAQAPTASVTNLIGTDACIVTVSGMQTEANAVSGVREQGKSVYTAKASALSNKNYKLPESAETEFVISRVEGKVNIAPTAISSLKYDGTEQELVTAGKSDDGTFLYSLDGGELTDRIPTAAGVGAYSVQWKLKGDTNHLDGEISEPITVQIGKGTALDITQPSANLGLIYNAEEQKLVSAGQTGEEQGRILYSLTEDGEYSTEIPTGKNAGEYTVWWRVEETQQYIGTESACISVAISPKAAELVWSETVKTYTGDPLAPTVGIRGVFAGDDCTAVLDGEQRISAGEYTVTASLTGTQTDNYCLRENTCLFTIEKIDPTLMAAPEQLAETVVYNGTYQNIVRPGSSPDGTIMYSTDGKSWQAVPPLKMHAETYTVSWYIAGDGNHNDSPISTLEGVIEPKGVEIEWVDADFVYTGESFSPTAKITEESIIAGDTCRVTVSGAAINAGSHTAEATGLDNADYKLPDEQSAREHKFVIRKAQPQITDPKAADNLIYTGKPIVLIVPGSVVGGTMQYSLTGTEKTEDWFDDVSSIVGTDAGDYEVYVRVIGDENHMDYPGEELSIVTSAPGSPMEDEQSTEEKNKNLLTAELTSADKYPHGTVTIKKAGSYLTKTPVAIPGLVYTGSEQKLVSAGESSAGYVEYSFDGENWSADVPTGKDAGSYSVFCRSSGDDNHNPSEPIAIADVFIAKTSPDAVTITASDIVYGQSLDSSIVTTTGDGKAIWKDPTFVPENAGKMSCTVIYTPNDTTNYESIEVEVELTVKPKTIEIVWNNISFTYNGSMLIPGAEASGLVGDDVCSLTVEGSDSILPGEYTARVVSLSNPNYVLPDDRETVYTIVPAEMNIVVNDVDVNYDGEWHGIEIIGLPENAVVEYSTDGESYSLTAPLFLGPCFNEKVWYKVSCEGYVTLEGEVSVTISEFSRVPQSVEELVYTGRRQNLCTAAELAPGIKATVTYSLDGEKWSRIIPTAANAGTYTVYFRTNTEGSPVGQVEVNIAKAAAGTVRTQSWTVGSRVTKQFTCTTPYSADVVFMIDGVEISSEYCKIFCSYLGSTVAEVSSKYLNGLSDGTHTFTFCYDNYETASGQLKVITRIIPASNVTPKKEENGKKPADNTNGKTPTGNTTGKKPTGNVSVTDPTNNENVTEPADNVTVTNPADGVTVTEPADVTAPAGNTNGESPTDNAEPASPKDGANDTAPSDGGNDTETHSAYWIAAAIVVVLALIIFAVIKRSKKK